MELESGSEGYCLGKTGPAKSASRVKTASGAASGLHKASTRLKVLAG